jgi:N-acetylglucosamine kinase-like BadF-type ATPase
LGYLLGDEGSGFYIGRKLLGDYIRGYMPEDVRRAFYRTFLLGREDILEKVYGEKMPNRFCAGFATFLGAPEIKHTNYARSLVKQAFGDFFENLVTRYENYEQYTFNCTGSVGYAFAEILAETAAEHNMRVGVIIKQPIEALADYHTLAISRVLTLKAAC